MFLPGHPDGPVDVVWGVVVEFQSERVGPANISLPAFPSEVFLSADFTPNYLSLTITQLQMRKFWKGLSSKYEGWAWREG